ncbi:DUF5993 family protein [Endozoicomonas elysicola]|uniref:DUF5993 family protein n=1 Tax=Endozoicomonas elysicola TaxID=305900 RepID=UPI0038B3298A
MVALLFLLYFSAAIALLRNALKFGLSVYFIAFSLSLYWFHFHATSALRILL